MADWKITGARKRWSKRFRLRVRAIRGAWAVARHKGIDDRTFDCLMAKNAKVRMAVIAAWEAGYRNGRKDEKNNEAKEDRYERGNGLLNVGIGRAETDAS